MSITYDESFDTSLIGKNDVPGHNHATVHMEVHHALVTWGDEATLPPLIVALRARGAVTTMHHNAWGIDESRALGLEAQRTDGAGQARLFVVAATTITQEAQNALLKLFEEPPRGVFFHCVFPFGMALLPTLRSRLCIDTTDYGVRRHDAEAIFAAWTRLPLNEQLNEVEVRTKQKDLVWVEAIRQGGSVILERYLPAASPRLAHRLWTTLSLLGGRGASNKMLLEDIALSFSSMPKAR